MKRLVWVLAGLGLVALSYYLMAYRWADVGGNIEAQVVIITPAFIAHHLLIRRHVNRTHAATVERLDAQDESLASTRRNVGELHGLHFHGNRPDPH